MKVSELGAATGVSIATIKYYLREALLPPGRRTAANQAEYDDGHVRRLRLIHALTDIGRLPLATVREVLQAVDDPDLTIHQALGVALYALTPSPERDDDPDVAEARVEVDRFLEDLGWSVAPDAPGRGELAVALATLRRVGWPEAGTALFTRYARAVDRLAVREVDRAAPSGASRAEIVERAVVGTVVFDAVVSALRRLAQERHSAERQA
jgi:DNA-binding transcriptional MerR regulator